MFPDPACTLVDVQMILRHASALNSWLSDSSESTTNAGSAKLDEPSAQSTCSPASTKPAQIATAIDAGLARAARITAVSMRGRVLR